jgi:hypothetical protein
VCKIKQLIKSYREYIFVPWKSDAAAAQRVIFCVYNEFDELRLRAKIDEFEIVTESSGHKWAVFDLIDTFAEWMSGQKYASKYFKNPALLSSIYHHYKEFIEEKFEQFLKKVDAGDNHVVAVKGVGSLFGFLKVKEVVERLAPKVPGRLLILFPGSYEDNNYRLLDGYDGWNYLAVPITADKIY